MRVPWAGLVATAGAATLVVAVMAPAAAREAPAVGTASARPVVRLSPEVNLSAVRVRAGYTYELASGATYTGTLQVRADDVTVQNAGPGRWPVITRHSYGSDIDISGRGDTVRWLRLTGQGYSGHNGYILGVAVSGTDAAITDVSLYGNLYAGVYFETTATGGVLSHSLIDRCDALNPQRPGTGGFGVLLWGAHNSVEDNTIDNQVTTSPVYGYDGSAVEVYHGRDNLIAGNTGANDETFTELGGTGATGNTYVGNTFNGPGDFLITRGSGDRANGPVLDTTMTGNHVKGEVVSYDWRPGDGTLLTLTRNVVSVPGGIALWTDGGYVNDGGNVFTGRVVVKQG